MQFARTASIAKGMGRDEACQFLTGNAATQFDPNVVEAFLVINDFIYLPKDCSRSQAIQLGEQAQDQISSFHLEVRPEQYAQVGLSFGVAESPTDGQSIDELVHAAALATRQQKNSLNAMHINSKSQRLPYSQARTAGSRPLTLVG